MVVWLNNHAKYAGLQMSKRTTTIIANLLKSGGYALCITVNYMVSVTFHADANNRRPPDARRPQAHEETSEGGNMKYDVYAIATASKYLGEVEADSEADAQEKAWDLDISMALCHQCSCIDIGDAYEIQADKL
jgi:hypothetical protein